MVPFVPLPSPLLLPLSPEETTIERLAYILPECVFILVLSWCYCEQYKVGLCVFRIHIHGLIIYLLFCNFLFKVFEFSADLILPFNGQHNLLTS